MKLQVTFKSPNIISDAIDRYLEDCINDSEEVLADKAAKLFAVTEKYVKYGELITVEFDTVAGTATVLVV